MGKVNNLKKKSRNKDAAAKVVNTEKYLTFHIDNQLYTVPTSEVVEIIRMQPITYMPNLPPYVKGVINLRGKIVPLIDMRLKFGKEEQEYGARTSVIIVEYGEFTVGLIVDSVKDVRDVSEDQISSAPKYKKDIGDNYIKGIVSLEKESAMLMDIAKVLVHKKKAEKQKAADDADDSQRVPKTAVQ
jgi:purine-binding chemotaxis protein CheW